jgi:DTW domain-containing protein YfiP
MKKIIPDECDEFSLNNEGRSICPHCDFLTSRCLCDTLKLIDNRTHIIILQHPTETKHPLNTVQILKKSFKQISLFIGEDFTHQLEINDLLNNTNNHCLLLYAGKTQPPITASKDEYLKQTITHLFLLDGTWRKAKRIFLTSQNLQKMNILSLSPSETSNYRIRKAPTHESLSTLEATLMALSIIEPQLDTNSAKLAFTQMIDFQIKRMGREIYQTNYLDKK